MVDDCVQFEGRNQAWFLESVFFFVHFNKSFQFRKNNFKVRRGWQVFVSESNLNDCILIINCFPLDCAPLHTLLILSFG